MEARTAGIQGTRIDLLHWRFGDSVTELEGIYDTHGYNDCKTLGRLEDYSFKIHKSKYSLVLVHRKTTPIPTTIAGFSPFCFTK